MKYIRCNSINNDVNIISGEMINIEYNKCLYKNGKLDINHDNQPYIQLKQNNTITVLNPMKGYIFISEHIDYKQLKYKLKEELINKENELHYHGFKKPKYYISKSQFTCYANPIHLDRKITRKSIMEKKFCWKIIDIQFLFTGNLILSKNMFSLISIIYDDGLLNFNNLHQQIEFPNIKDVSLYNNIININCPTLISEQHGLYLELRKLSNWTKNNDAKNQNLINNLTKLLDYKPSKEHNVILMVQNNVSDNIICSICNVILYDRYYIFMSHCVCNFCLDKISTDDKIYQCKNEKSIYDVIKNIDLGFIKNIKDKNIYKKCLLEIQSDIDIKNSVQTYGTNYVLINNVFDILKLDKNKYKDSHILLTKK